MAGRDARAPGGTHAFPGGGLFRKFEDGVGDGAQLFVAELRVEWEREDFGRESFRRGECGLPSAAEERLAVERRGIVNQRLDPARGEVRAQPFALWVAHDVEVEDVRARPRRRECESSDAAREQSS